MVWLFVNLTSTLSLFKSVSIEFFLGIQVNFFRVLQSNFEDAAGGLFTQQNGKATAREAVATRRRSPPGSRRDGHGGYNYISGWAFA